ncbi:glucan biosynthesis protein [Chthonobacter rhizosphaerae]|uniref:glucan biosynthesis protein n=1 Tax=Chthonobacter rhizosphaerae TaxID=2735553 RepID=UPI0015EF71E9
MDLNFGTSDPNRRDVLKTAASALATVLLAAGVEPALAQAAVQANFAVTGRFTRSTVAEAARSLAKAPFQPLDASLPEVLAQLTYDQYRDIRFKPDRGIWANTGLPFQMQLFHRGFYYKEPVEVAIVENGEAKHLAYDPTMFNMGPLVPQPVPTEDIGFSGIRLHGPINRPDYYDEVVVFQGASYFRSLGRGQIYGLSARALAIKTGDPEGEEFPMFRAFWVETPVAGSETCVIHALLDSPSTTGAFRFTVRPGIPTLMDVEAQLFPRVDLERIGLAPGTSMFFFSSNGRQNVDDFRPEVHDSDGLLMITGRGERLWRPLANPKDLQISAFVDRSPRGFGLIQRDRDFNSYQDLEAGYERRPSLFVEPVGDWGAGAVTLVEIPTNAEIHDNIVAFWSPQDRIPAGSEYFYAYRLAWGGDPAMGLGSAVIHATRSGRADIGQPTPERLFVIDYTFVPGVDRGTLGAPKATVSASKGTIRNVVIHDNPTIGGLRLSFQLDPQNEPLIELRANLTFETGAPAETWVYRWTA